MMMLTLESAKALHYAVSLPRTLCLWTPSEAASEHSSRIWNLICSSMESAQNKRM
ncbi:unnamed protein product [Penicillium roqueforti FM164]|uniref:Genomic scaffold, ProqFM164S04 n=1 Tax=Penicillium roqueforti (strain FM164) TaxID=1365484 RepID=W6QHS8_PENRF|nr:unnamed protein product [Penicillium roqueforti FM164]